MPNSLPIPNELTSLIERGFWPRNEDEARRQNLHCLLPESTIRAFAPEEHKIFFIPPPFCTVREVMSAEQHFWSDPHTVVEEIDPDLTLLIGDFGLGSDSPLALDYRRSATEPCVIRLRWAQEGNHWVELAPTFAGFVAAWPLSA
jgi:hypothetical protein